MEVDLAQDKASVVATSSGLAAAIHLRFSGEAGRLAHSARRLGIDRGGTDRNRQAREKVFLIAFVPFDPTYPKESAPAEHLPAAYSHNRLYSRRLGLSVSL